MGYQESMISVACVAEAAGVRAAVREYGRKYHVGYYGTERATRDIYLGTPWYAEDEPAPGARPDFREGSLFVVVGGQRTPLQHSAGMIFLDGIIGLRDVPFRDFFQNVSEEEVDAVLVSGQCQDAMEHAWLRMCDSFDEHLELDRKSRELDEREPIVFDPFPTEEMALSLPRVPDPGAASATGFVWTQEDELQWREQEARWEERQKRQMEELARRREERERMAAITPEMVERKVRELCDQGHECVSVREVAEGLELTTGAARGRMEKLVSAGSLVKRRLDRGRVAYALAG